MMSVALSDLAALAAAVAAASWVVFETPFPWGAELPKPTDSMWPLIAFLFASMTLSSALTHQMSGPGVPRPAYGRMAAILFGTMFLTTAMLVLFRDVYFSRSFIALTSAAWAAPAIGHRWARRRRPWFERIYVITNEKELADDLNDSDHAEVVRVLSPETDGPLDRLQKDVTVAVDLRAVLSDRVAQYLSSCAVAGYAVRPLTSLYEEHTGRVPLVHLAEGWEISAPLLGLARWLPGKRAFDFAFTAVTAVLWAPVGLLVAAYVKAADPGRSVFRQRRVGLGGEIFTMYKFRTMYVDAETEGPRFAVEDDPRLIPGGKFLRKSRLDEIPQLWNVLKGDMSLVGPRAEQVAFVSRFRAEIPFYDHRHMVRPGITGWAQVNYRYADDQAETVEKLTYDLYYVKHMSPVMDIRIFWKSIWTVISGSGAR